MNRWLACSIVSSLLISACGNATDATNDDAVNVAEGACTIPTPHPFTQSQQAHESPTTAFLKASKTSGKFLIEITKTPNQAKLKQLLTSCPTISRFAVIRKTSSWSLDGYDWIVVNLMRPQEAGGMYALQTTLFRQYHPSHTLTSLPMTKDELIHADDIKLFEQ